MGFRFANVDDRAVLIDDDHYYDLETLSGGAIPSDPMAALSHHPEFHALAGGLADAAPTGALAAVTLSSPAPRPQNSYGIGLNYAKHAEEGGMELPEKPMVFTKFPSCIVGPTADVELRGDMVDYEAELVAVIGKAGKDIAPADALDHVVGYTIGQDISDRPAQFMAKPAHFSLGKSFDTYGPMGPAIVSLDLLDDPADLALRCLVDDEVRQDDTTASLIFDVPYLVSFLSHITTLSVGDIIWTGTPEGIGFTQGKLLNDGEVITTEIAGLGSMSNRCVRVSDWES
jgi:2-keto-4-pentenoate hydratase/2-oxohepta-3-ene-1,7-dioic acid hydratase in catechol pathway